MNPLSDPAGPRLPASGPRIHFLFHFYLFNGPHLRGQVWDLEALISVFVSSRASCERVVVGVRGSYLSLF